MVSERFLWFRKSKSSRHSNKLGMFLLCVSNLKSEETRFLVPLVPGPLVYQLRSYFPSLGIWARLTLVLTKALRDTMVTLQNTQGIPVTRHESLELPLSPGKAQETSSFLGSRVLSLAFFGGLVSLCLFPSSATQKTRHVHVFCKNIGRAQ